MAQKVRLDKLLVQRGLVATRSKAQAIILAGEVSIAGQRVDKPGTAVPASADIHIKAPPPYVSRGGFKLAGALDNFQLDVDGFICADVGACTGGFTDVLLQRGALRVYAIDVGYGQLDWRLRQDERVVVMERTNARYVESLPELIQFGSIDVSFISLRLILPVVREWLAPGGEIVALIKPQFEAGRSSVGKGGIVRDPTVHRRVLQELLGWASNYELGVLGLQPSAITGTDGNREFLVRLCPGVPAVADLEKMIVQALGDALDATPPADYT